MSQIGLYAGWYAEHANGPFAEPVVEFMPGAFAYHLHSFSASTLRSTTRNWVGPLLAKGATITMGSVDEPYLSGTPDVAIFVARLVFNGFTFGEAAYASQSVLSWQTTVVGDPLYRPFGGNPEALHLSLERRQSKLIEWSHLRLANINMANGKPASEWIDYLEALELTKQSAVLSEKLGDLYASLGKPSSAVHAYESALKLDPSPQQKIRLRLTLGEKLTELKRDQEAYTDYQQLLKEAPAYPGKAMVESRISELGRKLANSSR
jgi:predicted negative regulator of RcsB-dependent stress response